MPTLITSTANSHVKAIRALRHRKEREATGLAFVEGIRIVAEAFELNADIRTAVIAPDLLNSDFARDLAAKLRRAGILTLDVTPTVFAGLSVKEGPQGIGMVVAQRWGSLTDLDPNGDLCWVALDRVADPGNLGTILRTSDAVGGSGVILIGPSADPYDPAAVRASMGALFAQHLVRADAAELAAWKARHCCLLVGASGRSSVDFQAAHYIPPVVLLMGSEREGLSAEDLELCDLVVSLPMAGRSDSLNLAVATGVMLYEIFTRNRDH